MCTILTVLMLSQNASSHPCGDLTSNFELDLVTKQGHRISESYALYVKQALVPLGIDVTVYAIPYGQFVGMEGDPFSTIDWDMTIGSFDINEMPDFEDRYTTKGDIGCRIYQLCDKGVQEFFLSDTGLNLTVDVDPLVYDAVTSLDPIERWDKTDQFAQLYMDQLLYDLPLIKVTQEESRWKGLRELGENGLLRPHDLNLIGESYLGYNFEGASAERKVDATTIQLSADFPMNPKMFDIYQAKDQSTRNQMELMAGSLLMRYNNTVYPYLAQQWFVEDRVSDGLLVERGRHTFIIDDGFSFSPTTDLNGNRVKTHPVDANDVKLALDYLLHPDNNLNGGKFQRIIEDYRVSSTYIRNDTIIIDLIPEEIGLLDHILLGSISPLPDHLLGGKLSFTEYISSNEQTTPNPNMSKEWQLWESLRGNTYAGMWQMDTYDIKNGTYSFKIKEGIPFPNEARTYNLHKIKTDLGKVSLNNVNTSGWKTPDLSNFAPHLGMHSPDRPTFFNWPEFKDEFAVSRVIYRIIEDDNVELVLFENGHLDQYVASEQGMALVQEYRVNDDYTIRSRIAPGSATLLAFNLKNEHLKFRDIRYAIASVIDKEEMAQINDGFAIPAHSPVSPYQGLFPLAAFIGAGPEGSDLSWYNEYRIPIDYATARDLTRNLGYTVADSPDAVNDLALSNSQGCGSHPVSTTPPETPYVNLNAPSSVLPFLIIIVLRRRYN